MNELLQNFYFKYPLPIRWSDMDALGHVNNAVYLTYLEEARTHYLAAVDWDWEKFGLIVARVELDYRMPLYVSDQAFVYVRCSKMGTKSFELSYSLTKEKDADIQLVAQAMTVMVGFDYQTQRTIPIPDFAKNNIETHDRLILADKF